MKIQGHNIELGDDGSLDTIIYIDGKAVRLSQDAASPYRDADTGKLNDAGLRRLVEDEDLIAVFEEQEHNYED